MVVHTLGHSTLARDDFLDLVRGHGIGTIADVRRWPASRRHPHFAREPLAAALAAAGIGYAWLPELGGRRPPRPASPHLGWRSPSFRGYADYMDTPAFAQALDELIALAHAGPTAILCAEAVPWRCHRQLIADALVARGITVAHVTGPGPASPHRLTPFARLDGTRVVYDRAQLELPAGPPGRRTVDRP